jgi:hypothetical protein
VSGPPQRTPESEKTGLSRIKPLLTSRRSKIGRHRACHQSPASASPQVAKVAHLERAITLYHNPDGAHRSNNHPTCETQNKQDLIGKTGKISWSPVSKVAVLNHLLSDSSLNRAPGNQSLAHVDPPFRDEVSVFVAVTRTLRAGSVAAHSNTRRRTSDGAKDYNAVIVPPADRCPPQGP